MRFPRSTHLLIHYLLAYLLPIISNDLTQMSSALLDSFISSDASMCSTMAFPPLGNSDVVVAVSIDFPTNSQRDALHRFIVSLMTILVLIGTVFVITFHGRITLNSVLLLLLLNFLRWFMLELIYVSLIESIRSSLTHLHGFQLLVLLP